MWFCTNLLCKHVILANSTQTTLGCLDHHWPASFSYLWLDSLFVCSALRRQTPADKSSWTVGSSWCCCTPTGCAF